MTYGMHIDKLTMSGYRLLDLGWDFRSRFYFRVGETMLACLYQ